MSPAYLAVRPILLAELKQFALTEQRELSLLVDAETGELIDRQVGELDEVTPDWCKVKLWQFVVALHTHPQPGGPGGEDWDVLCAQEQVVRMEVVDATAVWVVEKPAEWEFQETVSKMANQTLSVGGKIKCVAVFQVLFDRALSTVRRNANSELRDASAQIEETNRCLLNHPNLHGFKMWRES